MENDLRNKIDRILLNQISIQQDIDILKREILGNDKFGNTGYKHRIEYIESQLKKIEHLLNKRIWIERGILIAFGAVWTFLVKFWDKIFK